jgi:hypothetical protein
MTRTLHRDPNRRCMPIAEWPAADRASWLTALAPGDLLDEGGERARYAAASNRKTEKSYGRWLAWLQYRDLLETETSPAERITPERVGAYVAALSVFNASGTILARLQELHDAAAALDSSRNWHWIRQIAKRVRAQHRPARSKRERMVHVCDLLRLGETLMAEAPAADGSVAGDDVSQRMDHRSARRAPAAVAQFGGARTRPDADAKGRDVVDLDPGRGDKDARADRGTVAGRTGAGSRMLSA